MKSNLSEGTLGNSYQKFKCAHVAICTANSLSRMGPYEILTLVQKELYKDFSQHCYF